MNGRRTTFSEKVLMGAVAIIGLLVVVFTVMDKIHFSIE